MRKILSFFIAFLLLCGTLTAQQISISEDMKTASKSLSEIKNQSDRKESIRKIKEALGKIDDKSEAADELKYKAVKFSLLESDEDSISEIMSGTTTEQLMRIGSMSKRSNNFRTAREFFKALYQRESENPIFAAPALLETGICDLMIEPREKKAKETFRTVIERFPGDEMASFARSYLKAMGGSPSLESIQINNLLAYKYSRISRQSLKTMFAKERIIRASRTDFYNKILNNVKIPDSEKAKAEMIILQNLISVSSMKKVRNYVPRVLNYIEEGSPEEAIASFYIPYSYYKEMNYEKSIEEFNNYVSEYPDSPLVEKSYYYLARSYQLTGNDAQMWAVCDFCINEFPNTETSRNSRQLLKFLDINKESKDQLSLLENRKQIILTDLTESRKKDLSLLEYEKPSKNQKSKNTKVLDTVIVPEIRHIDKILSKLGESPSNIERIAE